MNFYEKEMRSLFEHNDIIQDPKFCGKMMLGNTDIREAAATLAGVTRIEAENVMAALIANKSIKKSDMDEIRHAKDRLFSDISGLEKIEVDESVKDVGGLAGLRKWLDEKKELLTPEKRDELKSKGLQPPRGILLV